MIIKELEKKTKRRRINAWKKWKNE
jgi:hypothetical protein